MGIFNERYTPFSWSLVSFTANDNILSIMVNTRWVAVG